MNSPSNSFRFYWNSVVSFWIENSWFSVGPIPTWLTFWRALSCSLLNFPISFIFLSWASIFSLMMISYLLTSSSFSFFFFSYWERVSLRAKSLFLVLRLSRLIRLISFSMFSISISSSSYFYLVSRICLMTCWVNFSSLLSPESMIRISLVLDLISVWNLMMFSSMMAMSLLTLAWSLWTCLMSCSVYSQDLMSRSFLALDLRIFSSSSSDCFSSHLPSLSKSIRIQASFSLSYSFILISLYSPLISFFFYRIFSYSSLTLSWIWRRVLDFSSRSKETFWRLFCKIFLETMTLSISYWPA